MNIKRMRVETGKRQAGENKEANKKIFWKSWAASFIMTSRLIMAVAHPAVFPHFAVGVVHQLLRKNTLGRSFTPFRAEMILYVISGLPIDLYLNINSDQKSVESKCSHFILLFFL